MLLGLLACCAFIAAVYVTGVHDASNAVAVPVRTRALGERSALYLAALSSARCNRCVSAAR